MHRYKYVCIWMIKCVPDLLKFRFHSYIYIWMFSDFWAAQDLFMQLLFLCKFVVIVVEKERTA